MQLSVVRKSVDVNRKWVFLIGISAVLLLALSWGWAAPSSPEMVEEFFPLPNHMEITVLSNDSTADFSWTLTPPIQAWDSTAVSYFIDVFAPDLSCIQVLWDSMLTIHHWDTLPQVAFWRNVMTLSKDSGIVNIASTRKIIETKSIGDWERLGDSLKMVYRDSVRFAYGLDSTAAIYITTGKNHYYQFEKALPGIGRGIRAFRTQGVDPWYAQAILLIESPGQIHMSPVGAYGSFQLMEEVALEYGLVVNDSIDEREDFEKAAAAAADLIRKRCLPQTRWMLRKRDIEFSETDTWFRLLVLHSYHAGAGNVEGVLEAINPEKGGMELMKKVWTTEYGGFKNASQNYSQVALASFLELDRVMSMLPDSVCADTVFLWKEDELAEGQMNY